MADTITYQYDKANGKLQFQFINHADGTWDVWQWDTQNQYAFAWQVFHGVGSGSNSLLSVGVQNDDGTYLAETFDTSRRAGAIDPAAAGPEFHAMDLRHGEPASLVILLHRGERRRPGGRRRRRVRQRGSVDHLV